MTDTEDGNLRAVFAETNQHMRSTEQKYLTLSVAYLGLVAVAMSLIHTKGMAVFDPSVVNRIVYIMMIFVGSVVYILQRWYRVWKVHYMEICRRIVQRWAIDTELVPYWLRNSPSGRKVSIDNALSWFTTAVNLAIVLLLCINISKDVAHEVGRTILAVGLFAGYVVFLGLLHFWVSDDRILNA